MHEFNKENGYWDCDIFGDNVETAPTIFETKYKSTCLLFAMCIVFVLSLSENYGGGGI